LERSDKIKRRATTPVSAAAHAPPPNAAAGRRSSGFWQRPCSKVTHLGEHPSFGRSGPAQFLAEFFCPQTGSLWDEMQANSPL
jgi:hypothetical protein